VRSFYLKKNFIFFFFADFLFADFLFFSFPPLLSPMSVGTLALLTASFAVTAEQHLLCSFVSLWKIMAKIPPLFGAFVV
jgi:hypothetical protein